MSAEPIEGPRGFVPRSELYRALARVDELTAELDDLRAVLAAITGARNVVAITNAGFTPAESQLLAALLERDVQPTDLLRVAYYPERDQLEDAPDVDNLIKVRICNIRRKARERGFEGQLVRTVWGVGYGLTPEGRQWLEDRLDRHRTDEPTNPASGHLGAITGHSRGAP